MLEQVALADFRTDQRFDKAFGVNVNVFWTTSAALECHTLRTVLVPGGFVHLVYAGPGDSRSDATERVLGHLTKEGFAATVQCGPEPALACITARP